MTNNMVIIKLFVLQVIYVQSDKVLFRINLPLFSTVLPSNSRLFLSCKPFVFITTFSTGCYNNEMPTGQKQSTVRWEDGGK